MRQETGGITRADESIEGTVWTVLGHTYTAKSVTDHSFSWHAVFPPGTFVPPHIHPKQDEYLYILEGRLDLWLDGREMQAGPGDTVRLPMGVPHGLFNKTETDMRCLFWVSPTGRLPELFHGIHRLAEQTPEAVVALSARYDVEFLPPPAA